MTKEDIASTYSAALNSVELINKDNDPNVGETEQQWKDRIKCNVDHLETIKAYTKEDGTTSIWTTEDFTGIDEAIITGKAHIA